MRKGWKAVVAAAFAVASVASVAVAAEVTGPSSSQSPYIVGLQHGIQARSILTTGDSVGSYRMVGIPDGLGAFDNGDGTFTVLMNHEIPNNRGVVRAHGGAGAFVSKWVVRKDDLSVVSGQDLIQNVATWNTATSSYNAPAKGVVFNRFCSATLAPKSAFYDAASGLGYDGRLFMNGEETAGGRAFAHALDGTSYELPRLGKLAYENAAANPSTGTKTVVVSQDDTSPLGQVYVYVGTKTGTGNAVARAGLTNGTLYGISVTGYPTEPAATGIPSGTTFAAAALGNVESWTGAQLETASTASGVTLFQRPEDGSWDTENPNVYYFVTTASFDGFSRLWRLTFNDASNPAAGGKIDMLLAGTEDGGTGERYHMLDNITVDSRGRVLMQEDPGNNPYLARLWQYDPPSDTLTVIAEHDPARFQVGGAAFRTVDEESSGIVDASSILGEGWFVLDVQDHTASPDPELVEGGQLLAVHVPPGKFPKHGKS
jgi:Bacterial protein of unknown function (DUF839)